MLDALEEGVMVLGGQGFWALPPGHQEPMGHGLQRPEALPK